MRRGVRRGRWTDRNVGARVAMGDHTLAQVLAGTGLGAAVAAVAYTATSGFSAY